MKKAMVALGLLAVIAVAIFVEVYYTETIYVHIHDYQMSINRLIDIDPEHIDTAEAISAAKEMSDYWDRHKNFLMSCGHHLMLLELDKSIIKQKTLIEINTYHDCKVETMVIMRVVDELRGATLPSIANML